MCLINLHLPVKLSQRCGVIKYRKKLTSLISRRLQDKTRQDKTRQDKTRQDNTLFGVLYRLCTSTFYPNNLK